MAKILEKTTSKNVQKCVVFLFQCSSCDLSPFSLRRTKNVIHSQNKDEAFFRAFFMRASRGAKRVLQSKYEKNAQTHHFSSILTHKIFLKSDPSSLSKPLVFNRPFSFFLRRTEGNFGETNDKDKGNFWNNVFPFNKTTRSVLLKCVPNRMKQNAGRKCPPSPFQTRLSVSRPFSAFKIGPIGNAPFYFCVVLTDSQMAKKAFYRPSFTRVSMPNPHLSEGAFLPGIYGQNISPKGRRSELGLRGDIRGFVG